MNRDEQGFLAIAVGQGILTREQAASLATEAARARRPVWELARGRVADAALVGIAAAWPGGTPPPSLVATTPGVSPAPIPAVTLAAGPPPPAYASAMSGSRYEVVDELGRGGMGQVLRVRDSSVGRDVAKKVILSDRSVPAAVRERFLREARITGQLEHPNIVPVYEVGREADGTEYFTMRLVPGRSLRDVLRAARAPDAGPGLPALVRMLLKVCEAVAYAHDRGVIHRDLKPDNVMTGDFGEVLVMDWGLARRLDDPDDPAVAFGPASASSASAPGDADATAPEDARLTGEGATIGTPSYMAPEQADDAASVDTRADVWALGAILYETVTGRPPFVGKTAMGTIRALIMDPVVPPRSAAPRGRAVPRELDAIALRALEKDPDARYPSVAALADDLTAYLEGRPVSALPEGPLRRALKWAGRHPGVISTAVGVLAVALIASGVIGVILSRQTGERLRAAEERAELAEAAAHAEEERRRSEAERARERREADAEAARLAEATRAAEAEAARVAAARAAATVPYLRVAGLVHRNIDDATIRDRILPPLEKAVATDPGFVEAWIELAKARYRIDRSASAQDALVRAHEACVAAFDQTGEGVRGSPHALVILGQILRRESIEESGDLSSIPAEARRWLTLASELAPDDPFAMIAAIHLDPTSDASLALGERLVREHPHLAEGHAAYEVVVMERVGAGVDLHDEEYQAIEARLGEALELLGPGPEIRAQLGTTHWYRGIARKKAGRRALAVDDFLEAERLLAPLQPPEMVAVLQLHIGEELVKLGRDDEGIARLDRAAEMAPAYQAPSLKAGLVLLDRGRAGEAVERLLEADRRMPAGADPALTSQVRFSLIIAAIESDHPDVAWEGFARLPARAVPEERGLLFDVRDWALRLVRALAALGRSRRETSPGEPLDRTLALHLGAFTAQCDMLAKRDLRGNEPTRAWDWADAGLALLAVLGADRDARLPESLEENLLGARATASFQLRRDEQAGRDLEARLAKNPRSDAKTRHRAAADTFNLAIVRARLARGDDGALEGEARAKVLELLAEAADLGFDRPEIAAKQPAFAALAEDEAFQATIAKMKR